jgi:hypothetical protein
MAQASMARPHSTIWQGSRRRPDVLGRCSLHHSSPLIAPSRHHFTKFGFSGFALGVLGMFSNVPSTECLTATPASLILLTRLCWSCSDSTAVDDITSERLFAPFIVSLESASFAAYLFEISTEGDRKLIRTCEALASVTRKNNQIPDRN